MSLYTLTLRKVWFPFSISRISVEMDNLDSQALDYFTELCPPSYWAADGRDSTCPFSLQKLCCMAAWSELTSVTGSVSWTGTIRTARRRPWWLRLAGATWERTVSGGHEAKSVQVEPDRPKYKSLLEMIWVHWFNSSLWDCFYSDDWNSICETLARNITQQILCSFSY